MRTSSLSLAALSAIAVLAAAATAHAQPGASPVAAPPGPPPPAYTPAPYGAPPPQIEINEKSPGTALILSLGGTVASFAIAASGTENALLGTTAGLGMWLAPSFGHWYVGDGWTTGLTYRMAGGAAVAAGAIWVVSQCVSHDGGGGSGDDCGTGGFALMIGGGAAFFGGMIYDIATAPGAARRHNERQRQRATQYQYSVTPTIGGDRVGFAVGGRF